METFNSFTPDFARNLWGIPNAKASIRGIGEYKNLRGEVRFYQTLKGVIVNVEIMGMLYNSEDCGINFYGFHIHEGNSCTGNEKDPLANVGKHYNPNNCNHPAHRGDLLPLISSNGYVLENFLIDSFNVSELIGKTIVIHDRADDFRSQPSGDSGNKIACGEIKQ